MVKSWFFGGITIAIGIYAALEGFGLVPPFFPFEVTAGVIATLSGVAIIVTHYFPD